MGRILYAAISKYELVAWPRTLNESTPNDIIKKRHGEDNVIYASILNDTGDCLICWYHNTKLGEPRASAPTAHDMISVGIEPPEWCEGKVKEGE